MRGVQSSSEVGDQVYTGRARVRRNENKNKTVYDAIDRLAKTYNILYFCLRTRTATDFHVKIIRFVPITRYVATATEKQRVDIIHSCLANAHTHPHARPFANLGESWHAHARQGSPPTPSLSLSVAQTRAPTPSPALPPIRVLPSATRQKPFFFPPEESTTRRGPIDETSAVGRGIYAPPRGPCVGGGGGGGGGGVDAGVVSGTSRGCAVELRESAVLPLVTVSYI